MPIFERLNPPESMWLSDADEIAGGGESRIFALPRHPALLAKIYREPRPEQGEKLRRMLDKPVRPAPGAHQAVAWPLDLLCDPARDGAVVGFLMPRLMGMRPLAEVYTPSVRRRECPEFSYRYLVRAARNLASAVADLHDLGYVIGDINESNTLVNGQALVTLVDVDSIQVRDSASATVYRCTVGKPDYLPRELQGKDLAEVVRSETQDRFGLAVLIFRLLMEGIHPFMGVRVDAANGPDAEAEPDTESISIEARIAAGRFPYGRRGRQVGSEVRPSPLALPWDTLDPAVRAEFIRAFDDGHDDPSQRPLAREWQTTLDEVEARLIPCDTARGHWYGRHLTECPWCVRAAKLGFDSFAPVDSVPAARALGKPPRPAPDVSTAASATAAQIQPAAGSHIIRSSGSRAAHVPKPRPRPRLVRPAPAGPASAATRRNPTVQPLRYVPRPDDSDGFDYLKLKAYGLGLAIVLGLIISVIRGVCELVAPARPPVTPSAFEPPSEPSSESSPAIAPNRPAWSSPPIAPNQLDRPSDAWPRMAPPETKPRIELPPGITAVPAYHVGNVIAVDHGMILNLLETRTGCAISLHTLSTVRRWEASPLALVPWTPNCGAISPNRTWVMLNDRSNSQAHLLSILPQPHSAVPPPAENSPRPAAEPPKTLPLSSTLELDSPVYSMAASADGRHVVLGLNNGGVVVCQIDFDPENRPSATIVYQAKLRGSVTRVAISPAGDAVVAGTLRGSESAVFWLDTKPTAGRAAPAPRPVPGEFTAGLQSVVMRSATEVVTIGDGGAVVAWTMDPQSARTPQSTVLRQGCRLAALSRDGRRLVTMSSPGRAWIDTGDVYPWDGETSVGPLALSATADQRRWLSIDYVDGQWSVILGSVSNAFTTIEVWWFDS